MGCGSVGVHQRTPVFKRMLFPDHFPLNAVLPAAAVTSAGPILFPIGSQPRPMVADLGFSTGGLR